MEGHFLLDSSLDSSFLNQGPDAQVDTTHDLKKQSGTCRAMKTKGMVFRYTWVYSKDNTMAHTCRPVVTS